MDYEKVRATFDYHEAGKLIWKIKKRGVRGGVVKGTIRRGGYLAVKVDYREHPIHRLIWLWHTGKPVEEGLCIDHINRDPQDNRIENLRTVTVSENGRNAGNYKSNTSGVKGVTWLVGVRKWRANIKVMGKLKNLGNYDNFDDAVVARLEAETNVGWERMDDSSPAYRYAVKNKLTS